MSRRQSEALRMICVLLNRTFSISCLLYSGIIYLGHYECFEIFSFFLYDFFLFLLKADRAQRSRYQSAEGTLCFLGHLRYHLNHSSTFLLLTEKQTLAKDLLNQTDPWSTKCVNYFI